MNLKLHFHHFDKPLGMEDLVEKKFKAISRRLDARISINNVDLVADVTQRKPDGRASKFSVMIVVNSAKPKKKIIVKKTASDFKKALNESLEAAEKILRRASEKMEHSRRKMDRSIKRLEV